MLMGRDIINMIECGFCHKEFDVATEDIEWEHQVDAGETDEDSSVHDYTVFQTIDCPHCGKPNKIVMHGKGKNAASLSSMEIVSLEKGSYLD